MGRKGWGIQMAVMVTLDKATAQLFGLNDGDTVTLAEFQEQENKITEQEKGRKRAARFVNLLNAKTGSVERQERLYNERIALADEAAKRRDRFSAELEELVSKQSERLADGYTVDDTEDGFVLMLNGERVDTSDVGDGDEDNGNGQTA